MNTDASPSSSASTDGAGSISNPGWTRYFDTTYNAYYWYNSDTKESRWEQQEVNSYSFVDTSVSASKRSNSKQHHQHHRQHHHKPNLNPRSFGEFRKEFESNPHYFLDPNSKEEDESEELLSEGKNKKPKKRWEMINRMICYKRFIFLHAVMVESPMAVIEAFLRAFVLLFAAFIMTLSILISLTCLNGHWFVHSVITARKMLRESLLTFVTGMSLLFFPCGSCFVYWNYKAEGSWEVGPIPTLLGWMDPRRLGTFSLGQGRDAKNEEMCCFII